MEVKTKMFKLPKLQRKGQSIGDAPRFIIILGIVGIVGAIMLLIMSTISASFTGAAAAAIANMTEAIANFFELTPVLGTVFIAVILLAAVAVLGVIAYRRMS